MLSGCLLNSLVLVGSNLSQTDKLCQIVLWVTKTAIKTAEHPSPTLVLLTFENLARVPAPKISLIHVTDLKANPMETSINR